MRKSVVGRSARSEMGLRWSSSTTLPPMRTIHSATMRSGEGCCANATPADAVMRNSASTAATSRVIFSSVIEALIVAEVGIVPLMACGSAHQQPVLLGELRGDLLRPDPVALLLQACGSCDVDGERRVEPSREVARLARREIVAARENGDTRASGGGTGDDLVGQGAAGVNRHDDIAGKKVDLVNAAIEKRRSPGEARPLRGHRLRDLRARRRGLDVNHKSARRRVVEKQHEVSQQPMAAAHVDHAAATKQ